MNEKKTGFVASKDMINMDRDGSVKITCPVITNEINKDAERMTSVMTTIANKVVDSHLKQTKHYLGNEKYVLYSYICDLGGNEFTFRCGTYAYSKIKNMFKCDSKKVEVEGYGYVSEDLDLNGEQVIMILCNNLDKKQMIISNKSINDYYNYDYPIKTIDKYVSDVGNEDIVLYFA